MLYAFLTATASSVFIVESLVMRVFPIPFIRLGLSNIVILYLVMSRNYVAAILINFVKSIIGGIFTFSLLTPATTLSVGAGISSALLMCLFHKAKLGFSIYGISIIGAVTHNVVQLMIVRVILIPSSKVFMLLPVLLSLALLSGIFIGYLCYILMNSKPNALMRVNNEQA